ncbi:MAG: DUF1232 domain-containing protein [Ignavibacteria bacterium]|nr:DUF1232 domain-containing protein [Ignavibacteria bacterium]
MQTRDDVGYQPTTESDFERKSDFIRANFAKKVGTLDRTMRFVRDLLALFAYMTDGRVHWGKKAIVIGALLYFIIPIDSVPDIIPVVGFLDDMGVAAAAVKFLAGELKEYYG